MKRILASSCLALLSLSLLGCDQRGKIESAHIKVDIEKPSQADSGKKVAEPNAGSKEASSDEASEDKSKDQNDLVFGSKFPKVLAVDVKHLKGDRWKFNVKLSSPYDLPSRYADAWRVLDDQDNELGIRVLGHDHASEQPFTRSQTIEVSSDTKLVFVEGRDSANGWSGQRFKVEMP